MCIGCEILLLWRVFIFVVFWFKFVFSDVEVYGVFFNKSKFVVDVYEWILWLMFWKEWLERISFGILVI